MFKKISALLLLLGLSVSGLLAQSITVTLPDTAVDAGTTISIPVRVNSISASDNVLSGGWTFTTSSDLVEFQSIDTQGTIVSAYTTQFNPTTGRFAFAATSPIEGSGVFFNLVAAVNPDAEKFDETTIEIINAQFNEGNPAISTDEGAVHIQGVSISPRKPSSPLVEGESYQFNLTGTITPPVSWSSSNNAVATVSSEGVVEGVAPGSIKIYAEDAVGLKDSTDFFRVEPATLLDLTVNVSDKAVYQTLEDTVQVLVSDVTGLNITSGQMDLSYSSDKIEILEVDTEGTILQGYPEPTVFESDNTISIAFADTEPLEGAGALINVHFRVFRDASGNAAITPQNVLFNESFEAAVAGGTIQIVEAPVPIVTPSSLDITEGETATFSVASGGSAPYTWSIEDESIATINSGTGELHALNRGITSVIATDADGFTSDQIQVTVNDVTVSMPSVEIVDEDTVTVPVETMDLTGLGILAYEIEVEYDPNIATYHGTEISGTLSEGLSVIDSEESGIIKIAMATTSPMEDAGALVHLRFSAAASAGSGDTTTLGLRKMQFNEAVPSSPTATKESGSIVIEKTVAPAQVQLTAPADGATDIGLDAGLEWSATEGADSYEVVLSQNADFSNPKINESGISGTTFDPSSDFEYETTYFWRVRGAGTGSNGEWSATWSFTTQSQPLLDAPVLTSPDDGANDLTQPITFSWNAVTEATEYTLKISLDSGFNAMVFDSTTGATTLEVSLEPATTYFWSVTASDSLRSTESETRSFTTQVDIAGTPELFSPGNNATGIDTSATLRWSATQNTESYRVELATTSAFDSNVSTQEVSDTLAIFSGLDLETTYFWRVTAVNSRGDGGTSDIFSFTTRAQDELAAPNLLAPQDNAADLPASLTFSWSSVPGAHEYHLLVATDNGFTDLVVDSSSMGTEVEITGLSTSTTYYWKVTASDGSLSSESAVRSFTTYNGLPAAPELVSPSNNATDIQTTVTLTWSAADLAQLYRVDLSTSQSFSNDVQSDTFTATSAIFDGLDSSTTYYWRVTGINDQGEGESSQIFSFTTIAGLPGAPLLSSPNDGVADIEPPIEFSWEQALAESTTGVSYQIQIATERSFSNVIIDKTTTGFSILVSDFSSETDLFWRVRGQNNQGNGAWSEVRSFSLFVFEAPTEVTATVTRSFGDAADPQDYRLVALPGQVNASLASLLDGTAGVEWQAFWDNGSQQDFLVKYDRSSIFSLESGNGFWVTSTEPIDYNETIDAVELDNQRQATIPLHDGWNIISNPLDIDVPWSVIKSANGGAMQPIWGFEGAFEETSDFVSAKTGKAFYFLNDQALDELVIPYQSSAAKENSKSNGDELRLTTHVEGEQTSSSRIVFVDQRSKSQVDVIAPPSGFENASTRFTSKISASERSNALAGIYRLRNPQGQDFEVVLTATPDEPVTVRLNGWDRSVSANAMLIDKNTGQSYDLSSPAGVHIKPEKKQTRFLFVMGSREYLDEQQTKFLPEQVQLMPNYPNPFNPATTIRFVLPQESKVQLQVFDVIGRRVATLINNDVRSAGIHRVSFDASRQASGMYFAVIQVGNQRFVQKMLLVK